MDRINKKNDIFEYIVIAIIIIGICIAGLITSSGNEDIEKVTMNTTTSHSDTNLLTLEKAKKLVGKTVREICSQYGNHNIHILVYIDGTFTGEPCDDLYPPHGEFVITKAYYDNNDEYDSIPEEYRGNERRVYFEARGK